MRWLALAIFLVIGGPILAVIAMVCSSSRGRGICRMCGCTDFACEECVERLGRPCHWVDASHMLCSACSDIADSETGGVVATP
jgi:hypothetical protein